MDPENKEDQAEATKSTNATNPYIDENLMHAQQKYNPQQNKEFEQKHNIVSEEKSQTKKNKKYEMHPFSKQILEHKDDQLLVMIRRDKAPNPVVYRARYKNNNIKNGFAKDPIEIFWLKIAYCYIESHRKAGKQDDRMEMKYIELKMAYGIKYEKIKNKQEYKVVFIALPKWSCILKICPKESKPKLFGNINGNQCYLTDIHVQLKKKTGWFRIPSVDYITLKGYRCDNNVYVEHVIKP
eukprot:546422_1